MAFSISNKYKKDKYTVCCSRIKCAASTEIDWNKNLHLQQSACLTLTVMVPTTELNYNWDISQVCVYLT